MLNTNTFNKIKFLKKTLHLIKTQKSQISLQSKNSQIQKYPILKTSSKNTLLKTQIKNFSEIEMPDHLKYNIPKYNKNPDNVDFPWLIGGAPFLELKVKLK